MLAVTHNIRGERRVGCETDVQYDWYGRRLATASTDLTVRIRDLDERGEWVIHDGCEIMNAHAVRRPQMFLKLLSYGCDYTV